MSRMPLHGLEGWEAGGMSTLKTKKTASRTGTRLWSGFLRQQGQLGTTLSRSPGWTTPPGRKVRMKSGREEEDKQDKGEQGKQKESGQKEATRMDRRPLRGRNPCIDSRVLACHTSQR